MRILLIGAGGQLAEDFRRILTGDEVVPVSHGELDIREGESVAGIVQSVRPGCIINTAAFNLVDACEDHSEDAIRTNTIGVYHLARSAQLAGAALVHFSTNYVFDGQKQSPYVENDVPRPLSVYGFSKLGGEWAAQQYCEKHFVVRTAALYGCAGNRSKGGNFAERLIRAAQEGKPLRIVNDQIINPTHTADLARCVSILIRQEQYGLYHAVNEGGCSWFEFAQEIFRAAEMAPNLLPTTSVAFPAKARRPAYSALENAALRRLGLPAMRPWREALADYMRSRAAVTA